MLTTATGPRRPPGRRLAPRFPDTTFWSLVVRRAEETPDRLMAVNEEGQSFTFGQYRERCERVAAGLALMGVGEGTPVSWQLPTTLDAFVVLGALSRLGAVQNPIVPIYRDRELSFVLRQTGAQVLIVPSMWRGYDYEAMAKRVTGGLGSEVTVIVTDHGLPEGPVAGLPPQPVVPASAADLPVRWVYYTSGSTSDPKGVLHTDATLGTVAVALVERLAMVPEDRTAMVFPFAHIGGSNFLMSALLVGCACICVETFDPVHAVDVLAREEVTLAGAGTTFHLAYLAAQRARPEAPLFPHVRAFPGGGAPKPPQLHYELKEEMGGAGIVSALGLTECQMVGMCDIEDPDEKLATTEGRTSPGAEVKVVAMDERICAADEEGELRLIAPQMFLGYLDASLNDDAFDEEGFFRTGDLGFLDEDGYVHVVGRLKDVINRKGENISAKEVEDLLYQHPGVLEVAVIGLPDPQSGERCCAVVVPADPGAPIDLAGLVAYLRDKGLMTQKIPEQLEIVSELPKAPAGKVLKQELQRRFASA